jgi:hypothetical protein
MSLFYDAIEPIVILDRKTVSDGEGGTITTYVDGVEVEAAVTFDTSLQARTAEALGVTSRYTVATKRNVNLQYHDVFRRVKDGKIFRVTSDGDDRATPKSASLDMRVVTAEEWSLPR